jgi:hypothetical protein
MWHDAACLYASPISPRADRFFAEPAGESIIDWRVTRFRNQPMEFTLLFLATAILMLIAWRGQRPLALGLFGAILIACVATYLHHATDTLKLSF